jgi:bifunctional non-homologous end joining protein LigD
MATLKGRPKGQDGGGTVQLWDCGYWEPDGDRTPEEALARGDFKFVLDGERLHGGWVLVGMKWDRKSGKHTNWLLIKRRDEFAQDGKAKTAQLPRGRSMATIAAGRGRSPKPFMLAANKGASPDAVWVAIKAGGGCASTGPTAVQFDQRRTKVAPKAVGAAA